ncbi:STAS domain-containing protein [Geodermatophilus nigrescens]
MAFSSAPPARCTLDLASGHVALHGELDDRLHPLIGACLVALGANRPRVWLIDLRSVTFCDVPTLRLFLQLEVAARCRGAHLLLVGAPPWLADLLGVLGLGRLLVDEPVPAESTVGTGEAELSAPVDAVGSGWS